MLFGVAMRRTQLPLLLVAVAAVPAIAYDWAHVAPFSRPANIDNHCVDLQRHGFHFQDVEDGPIGIYGDMLFSNFTVRGRTTQDHRDRSTGHIAGILEHSPSISAIGSHNFSIQKLQLRSSCHARIELQYRTADGLMCTDTHNCTTSPSTLVNTQCGGESISKCQCVRRHAISPDPAERILPHKDVEELSD